MLRALLHFAISFRRGRTGLIKGLGQGNIGLFAATEKRIFADNCNIM